MFFKSRSSLWVLIHYREMSCNCFQLIMTIQTHKAYIELYNHIGPVIYEIWNIYNNSYYCKIWFSLFCRILRFHWYSHNDVFNTGHMWSIYFALFHFLSSNSCINCFLFSLLLLIPFPLFFVEDIRNIKKKNQLCLIVRIFRWCVPLGSTIAGRTSTTLNNQSIVLYHFVAVSKLRNSTIYPITKRRLRINCQSHGFVDTLYKNLLRQNVSSRHYSQIFNAPWRSDKSWDEAY